MLIEKMEIVIAGMQTKLCQVTVDNLKLKIHLNNGKEPGLCKMHTFIVVITICELAIY